MRSKDPTTRAVIRTSAGEVPSSGFALPPPAREPRASPSGPPAPGDALRIHRHLCPASHAPPRPTDPELPDPPTVRPPSEARCMPIRCAGAEAAHASISSGARRCPSRNASTPTRAQRRASGTAPVPSGALRSPSKRASTPIRESRPRKRTASSPGKSRPSANRRGPIIANGPRASGAVQRNGTGPDTVPKDAEGGSYERGTT